MQGDSRVQRKLQALAAGLVDLIFPPACVYCRRLGSHFCRPCQQTAQFLGDAICVRCGIPAAVRCTCAACRPLPPGPLCGMRGAVRYQGPVRFAIHAFKYRGMTDLAAPLAGYLVAYLEAYPLAVDYLVPVPLHEERLAFRGYNQSELLATTLGKARGLPVRTDLIARTRHTQPQVQLKARQRRTNMHEAFAPLQAGCLRGETVLLIDDVGTTGSTLNACAVALQEAGAGDIWALTVARAYYDLHSS